MTQSGASGAKGAVGQARNPDSVFWLSLLTCGIYGLYWDYLTFDELKNYNGDGLGPIGVVLCWLFVGYFILITEIQKMYEADGKQSPLEPIEAVWLFVPIYGLWRYLHKVQAALNDFWVSKGAAPAA
jgi:Domain of unknown function (DUF4234)